MNQVYLKTKGGQYFVVRKIPDNKLKVMAIDLQKATLTKASTVELHEKETELAIVFIRGDNKYLLTVQENNKKTYLELKEVTAVRQEDYCFKWKNLGAGDYYSLSSVKKQVYIRITETHVDISSEITEAAHVTAQKA